MERFRAGRDEAFRVLHDRYRARLLAYVRQMLGARSSEDFEDVVQDVFERAAKTLRTDGAPDGLRAWLYSVAHNRCIDELRRRVPASPDVLAASRSADAETGAVAERRADVEQLFRDLRRLPELQRSALLMRELQGLSHAELAQALDASVPAVKSLLVRARVGLVDADQARSAPCTLIRDDLAATHDRRVKASAHAARHLRECAACRSYRAELTRTSRRLGALVPGPALFPLAELGRLLGGAGLHAEAPAAATGGLVGSGGAAIAGAGKLVALIGAAGAVTTGAVLERTGSLPWSSPPAARQTAPGRGGPAGHGSSVAGSLRPARLRGLAAPSGHGGGAASPGSPAAPATPASPGRPASPGASAAPGTPAIEAAPGPGGSPPSPGTSGSPGAGGAATSGGSAGRSADGGGAPAGAGTAPGTPAGSGAPAVAPTAVVPGQALPGGAPLPANPGGQLAGAGGVGPSGALPDAVGTVADLAAAVGGAVPSTAAVPHPPPVNPRLPGLP